MFDTTDFVVRDLLEASRISPADLDRAKQHSVEKCVDILAALVATGRVSVREVALARAAVSESAFLDLDAFDIDIRNAELMPRGVAVKLAAFPLFNLSPVVTVGMVDPLNLSAVDQLRQLLRAEIDPVLCEREALMALIDRAYSMASTGAADTEVETKESAAGLDEEPIVAAVNQIIASAIDEAASDIHINPDERELVLRHRIDGVLHQRQGPSLAAHPALVQRIKVMAGMDLTQTRRPQDGKFHFTRRARTHDIRVSIVPTVCGENVVMRLLSRTGGVKGFAELGLAPAMIEAFEALISRPHGMLLVTGPTGSGKTSTLYAALARLNTPGRNVMTIEDPVEMRLPLVRQTQVNPEIGLTFAAALRSMLRQDPNVILVGEIRDDETAQIAMQAALTGHLVLTTLHTNDALGALARLRDLGAPTFAVHAAVLGVLAQRLVRRVCEHCRQPDEPTEAALRAFALDPDDARGLVRAVGCARCLGAGYRGRVGVYELFRMTPRAVAALEGGATAHAIRAVAASEGMRPMWTDGLEKARLGLTTLDELLQLRAAVDDAAGAPHDDRTAAWRLSA